MQYIIVLYILSPKMYGATADCPLWELISARVSFLYTEECNGHSLNNFVEDGGTQLPGHTEVSPMTPCGPAWTLSFPSTLTYPCPR